MRWFHRVPLVLVLVLLGAAAPTPSAAQIDDADAFRYVRQTADSYVARLFLTCSIDVPRRRLARHTLDMLDAMQAHVVDLVTDDPELDLPARAKRLERMGRFADLSDLPLGSASDLRDAVGHVRRFLRVVVKWGYDPNDQDLAHAGDYRRTVACALEALEDWCGATTMDDLEIPDFGDCALDNAILGGVDLSSTTSSALMSSALGDTSGVRNCKWFVCNDGVCRPYCPDIQQDP